MKEIIEIYSKIVVATFGFIGPSFTLLISIFIDAIEKARIKKEQQLETLQSLYDSLYKSRNNTDIEKGMKKILKENAKQKTNIIKETNLLNPKRQIKRVFIPLIMSLFFISLYYYARTSRCIIENIDALKIIAIILSLCFFAYCLFALWQILNMVIDAKQAAIKDKTDKVVKQEIT
ncbi:hypothetical protein OX284_009055 [Flavobacterium sp. SUN046]|uniref:hypothetical protein n=1 Tax=Flavobacterium sp. SUN046 TaxID=3002440 RepID=UPI002DB9F870|nr:hypothetical protein [Flavobacterium sp. SUN046]MEC4049574.1 hypothetical protein [Flavobacterium sp. SUN046]